jgi:hypothetical protein
MMYIEDLAILAESFISDRDFYELITDSSINIGDKNRRIYQRSGFPNS